jgi:hypothetical protein
MTFAGVRAPQVRDMPAKLVNRFAMQLPGACDETPPLSV